MDWSSVTQIISSLGFPIVMCCILFWYIKDTGDKHIEQVRNIMDNHREEMAEITTALNNNTLVIQKLCDKMDLIQKGE